MENAIKGVYGSDTDASKYLDKFVNFYFKFPKQDRNIYQKERKLSNFIELTMSKYNFEKNDDNDTFTSWIKHWSVCFDLSLRDIEKCVALYAFIYPNRIAYILTYFIALKVKNKILFEKLIANDIQAHNEAKEFISNLIDRSNTESLLNKYTLQMYYQWHDAHCTNFQTLEKGFQQIINELDLWHMNTPDLFKYCGNMLDVNIEN